MADDRIEVSPELRGQLRSLIVSSALLRGARAGSGVLEAGQDMVSPRLQIESLGLSESANCFFEKIPRPSTVHVLLPSDWGSELGLECALEDERTGFQSGCMVGWTQPR